MVRALDLPVLSLAIPNICQSDDITAENIYSMWSVFSKCKDHLENGRRLENLSWRIWFRESIMVENYHYQEKEKESTETNDSNKNNELYNGALQKQQQQQTPISIYHHHQQQHNNNDNENEDVDYFQASTSTDSSMKDSAVSGCDRSFNKMSVSSFKRMVSSLGSDHPVEEARRAFERQPFSSSVTKPTAAETTRLFNNNITTYNSMIVRDDEAVVVPHVHCQKEQHNDDITSDSWNKDKNTDNKFYLKEEGQVENLSLVSTFSDNSNDDEESVFDDNENKHGADGMDTDTLSEWSAQDDETVFADDDNDEQQLLQQSVINVDHHNYRTTHHWEFRKQIPKENDDPPKQSLLSIMFKKHQEQDFPKKYPSSTQRHHNYYNHHHQRMRSTASSSTIATITSTTNTEYIYHYHHNNNTRGTATIPIETNRAGRHNIIQYDYNNNNNNNGNNVGDLSESLQFSVNWERRQNVSSPVVLLQKEQRRLPAFAETSRATATCRTTATTPMTSWVESFRGW
ncbi:hypothetical protein INT45_000432 [Circinella minor]|uniref:Nitrogen regulatory protein areA GATA-like domain-containing protein n=1 Tax=Circinella minor TaxID=1195481 RepID=A0A8H7RW49_9FUNG|nr:hypothetical protein INT45_000432 [Circinella minor]